MAAECVSSLAIDEILQMHLLQAGALWHLLIFLFDYDYTLEEGGVEAEEESSKQLVANKLAKLAVLACARLAGLIDSQDLASPKNPVIKECLESLITPYIVQKMGENKPEEVSYYQSLNVFHLICCGSRSFFRVRALPNFHNCESPKQASEDCQK